MNSSCGDWKGMAGALNHVSIMQSAELHSSIASGDAEGAPELPLIDQRVLSDWSQDMDKEDVRAILAQVPDETAKSVAALKEAIERSDLTSARRAAHRLKGMASNLGAARLARMARAIELGSQSIDEAAGQMAALQRTVSETLEALRSRC
jgi:HPt (histidine-containing phosphotransfer) domain-containing protein